jgi:hypothetical protein
MNFHHQDMAPSEGYPQWYDLSTEFFLEIYQFV